LRHLQFRIGEERILPKDIFSKHRSTANRQFYPVRIMLVALAADRARIADIETRILELERSIAELQLEKTLVQEQLDSYKYPVMNLPDEIVSEIFTHFLPIYPLCPPLAGLLSPTALTHICHTWREIAQRTPQLWRAISLSFDGIPFRATAHISDVLSRSGCCPLSIFMDDYADSTSEVFTAVVAHRPRWEYLKLCVFSSDLSAIKGRLPLLRHVDLEFEDNAPDIMVDEAPLLRSVILSALEISDIVLPWAQLTSLTLNRLGPDDCVPILQQTSNLVHCELSLYSWNYDDDIPLPDVTLPYLESLTLIDRDVDGPMPGYLNTFVVPALRSLQISESSLQPGPITSLTSFISKSGCKLQDVHITEFRVIPRYRYRRAFPSIQNFSFDPSPNEEESATETYSNSTDIASNASSDH
jgi:hypothetical protein